MGSAQLKKIEGFLGRGGEEIRLNPHNVIIDGVDRPQTDEFWFAFCPRAREPVSDKFVESFRQSGNLDDVKLYKIAGSDKFGTLDGRRSIKALRIVWDEEEKAGVPEDERKGQLKGMVVGNFGGPRATDPRVLHMYNVNSESTREPLTPMQRAESMAHALKFGGGVDALTKEPIGLTSQEVAESFGVDERTVRNTVKLLTAVPSLQKAVDSGGKDGIAMREAVKLAGLPAEKQESAIKQLQESGSTRTARK